MGLINDIKNRSLSGNELHANKHNWGKAMLAYEKACSTYTGISKEDKDLAFKKLHDIRDARIGNGKGIKADRYTREFLKNDSELKDRPGALLILGDALYDKVLANESKAKLLTSAGTVGGAPTAVTVPGAGTGSATGAATGASIPPAAPASSSLHDNNAYRVLQSTYSVKVTEINAAYLKVNPTGKALDIFDETMVGVIGQKRKEIFSYSNTLSEPLERYRNSVARTGTEAAGTAHDFVNARIDDKREVIADKARVEGVRNPAYMTPLVKLAVAVQIGDQGLHGEAQRELRRAGEKHLHGAQQRAVGRAVNTFIKESDAIIKTVNVELVHNLDDPTMPTNKTDVAALKGKFLSKPELREVNALYNGHSADAVAGAMAFRRGLDGKVGETIINKYGKEGLDEAREAKKAMRKSLFK